MNINALIQSVDMSSESGRLQVLQHPTMVAIAARAAIPECDGMAIGDIEQLIIDSNDPEVLEYKNYSEATSVYFIRVPVDNGVQYAILDIELQKSGESFDDTQKQASLYASELVMKQISLRAKRFFRGEVMKTYIVYVCQNVPPELSGAIQSSEIHLAMGDALGDKNKMPDNYGKIFFLHLK